MADAPARPAGGFGTMLLLLGGMFLMLSEPVRNFLGNAVGFGLTPAIGFDGRLPLVTLLLASVVTGVLTGVARHWMVDWARTAELQSTIKAFHKQLREAQKEKNNYKVKRLMELQPKVLETQMEMQQMQMKPMILTMGVVVPVFAWLWAFLEGVPVTAVAAPWGGTTELFSYWGPFGWSFIPKWILLYSLFSIPVAQLVQRGLKLWDFARQHDRAVDA